MWLIDREDEKISASTLVSIGFEEKQFENGEKYWGLQLGPDNPCGKYYGITFFKLPTITEFYQELFNELKQGIDEEWKEKLAQKMANIAEEWG